MRYILIFIILILQLDAKEIDACVGNIKKSDDNGNYQVFYFRDGSEDETINYQIGFRNINFYRDNYHQFESLFKIDKEIDIDKRVELGILNIDNKIYGGNLYISRLKINSFNDYYLSAIFSKYNNGRKIYQTDFSVMKFLNEYPLYIKPVVYIEKFDNNEFYHPIEINIGYIMKKDNIELSYLKFKNRYLFTGDDYISCNFGLITETLLKVTYIKQITKPIAIKIQYRHQDLEKSQYLDVASLAINYRY